MKAIIMAAGVGTRLEPLTLAVPKPLVPICNIPVMQHIINLLKRNGIREIAANLHYFPEQIQNYFQDGSKFGVNIQYSYEENLLGTAGGVKKMARLPGMDDDIFLVLSADVMVDIDINKLVSFHNQKKALATIALSEVDDTSEYGVVVTGSDGRITRFQEKPKKEEASSKKVNMGVYVLSKKMLDLIPKDRFCDFGKELFPLLVKEKLPFYGYDVRSYWVDIGNVANYKKANIDCLREPHLTRDEQHDGRFIDGIMDSVKNALKIKPNNRVLIGHGSRIDPTAVLEGNVIIGNCCTVRTGALIKDSIIWSDTVIDRGAGVDSSIIGSWCYIEENASVCSESIIANRCRIRRGTKIESETMMPDQTV